MGGKCSMLENANEGGLTERYRAYLLRLWREVPGQPWRVLLQDASTLERYGFQDLDHLMVFLNNQIDGEDASLRITQEIEESKS